MRVVLVHDWLTGMRGGERVLERIAAMHPGAPIHTLVWRRGSVSPALEAHPVVTSFLQRLPGAERRYRWFLPLFPRAIESLRLPDCDAVISTSHAVARGVLVPPGAFHLSYVHTPMRYVWDLEQEYFPPGRFPWPLSWYVRRTCARLRDWDVRSCSDALDARNGERGGSPCAVHITRLATIDVPRRISCSARLGFSSLCRPFKRTISRTTVRHQVRRPETMRMRSPESRRLQVPLCLTVPRRRESQSRCRRGVPT